VRARDPNPNPARLLDDETRSFLRVSGESSTRGSCSIHRHGHLSRGHPARRQMSARSRSLSRRRVSPTATAVAAQSVPPGPVGAAGRRDETVPPLLGSADILRFVRCLPFPAALLHPHSPESGKVGCPSRRNSSSSGHPFRRARVPQHTDPEFFYLIIVGHIFFENTNVTNHLKIGLLNPDVNATLSITPYI
jgi:hypothetical protein